MSLCADLADEASTLLECAIADSTVSNRKSVAKHWAVFCIDIVGVPITLLSQGKRPSRKVRHSAENTLIWCVSWLARSFESSTVGTYISHVKGLLSKWLGFIIMEDLGFTWSRLNYAIRILKSTRPAAIKFKRPFTFGMMQEIAKYWQQVGRANMTFPHKCIWAAMVLCFNQLLRGNEVAQSSTFSFANRLPMVQAHLKHFKANGSELCCPVSSTDARDRLIQLASSKLKMPPTKCDPEAANLPLYLTGAAGGLEEWLSPASQLFLLQGDAPVASYEEAQYTVLFPAKASSAVPISASNFLKVAKAMCAKAGIDNTALGTHAFRVGGMNHLQESGATIAQIMAIGRWSSDAYKLYSRRNRKRLVVWSRKLMQAAPK